MDKTLRLSIDTRESNTTLKASEYKLYFLFSEPQYKLGG